MNISDLGRKALNRMRSGQYTRELQTTQFLSTDELHALRLRKLKHIIRVAIDQVPRYAYLRSEIDVKNIKFEDLQKFPIVRKEDYRDDFDLYQAGGVRSLFAHDYRTSGSTGKRFRFRIPFWSGAFEEATAYRAWSMGKDYAYKRGDSVVFVRTYAPKSGQPLYKYDRVHNYHYLSPFSINDDTVKMYAEVIERSGAQLLRAYPSSAYLFTLMLKKHAIRIPAIKSIVTASETLLPMYRATVEEYWGVPVLDWYGQNERTVTMQQCWAGTYHNNDEYGIVEFDSNNQIIATSLVNDVMPFIRYATGDYALPRQDRAFVCPCGRRLSSPVLRIDGRSDDLLSKPDGTIVPTINIYTAMEKFDAIRQFSILQHPNKELDLTVSLHQEVPDSYLEGVKSAIRQRAGDLPITVTVVSELPRDPETQKQRAVRSLVKH